MLDIRVREGLYSYFSLLAPRYAENRFKGIEFCPIEKSCCEMNCTCERTSCFGPCARLSSLTSRNLWLITSLLCFLAGKLTSLHIRLHISHQWDQGSNVSIFPAAQPSKKAALVGQESTLGSCEANGSSAAYLWVQKIIWDCSYFFGRLKAAASQFFKSICSRCHGRNKS